MRLRVDKRVTCSSHISDYRFIINNIEIDYFDNVGLHLDFSIEKLFSMLLQTDSSELYDYLITLVTTQDEVII